MNKEYRKNYYNENKDRIIRQVMEYQYNSTKYKEYQKEYSKLEIYCEDCGYSVNKAYYKRHLTTLNHKLNSK